MMWIGKILRLGWVFGCISLLPCAPSLAQSSADQNGAQTQSQTPSTSDLESQPNTLQYPRARRRPFVPPPNDNTPNADPPSSDPPANSTQPNNAPQPNPDVRPATQATTAPASSAPVTSQRTVPQQSGFIGPPVPLPPTPEQMAPTAPRITYHNGLLSVESVNARLVDILNGIRAKAGIQFEGLQTSSDRVAGKFGPAPAGEVLTNLLQGSRYDYVIIGTPDNPAVVQRVILTPTANAAAAAGTSPAGAQPAEATGDEEDSDDDAETTEQTPQTPQQPRVVPGQPRGNTGTKTPEELLEELRRMQQQSQQQNQQNQNQQNQNQPTPPNPAPRQPGPPN